MSKDWYIVTNTENLEHFFNFNLIIDKQGFTGNSYETDAMHNLPKGYLPCFSAKDLSYALRQSKVEDTNLISCLLRVDINQFNNIEAYGGYVESSGSVTGEKKGRVNQLTTDESVNCVLLPAPLPFSVIKNIILETREDKERVLKLYEKNFQSIAKKIPFKAQKNIFKLKDNADSQQEELVAEQWTVESREIEYNKAFSYGGVLGLLYYQSKNGLHSTNIFNAFSDLAQIFLNADGANQKIDKGIDIYSPYLGYLINRNDPDDYIEPILNLLIPQFIKAQDHGVIRHTITNPKVESIPESYRNKYEVLTTSIKQRVIEKIDKKGNQISITIDDIFTALIKVSYKEDIPFKNFAAVLTMLAALGSIETIIKYYHPDFTEQHYALHAVFAGLVYGVVNLPNEIRQFYDLSTWLSYKMAQFLHSKSDSAVEFKEPKKPLLIYGDMLKLKPSKALKTHDFYEWLVKNYYKPKKELEAKILGNEAQEGQRLLSFYEWLTSNNYKPSLENQKDIDILVRWERAMPKNYTIENSKMITTSRPARESAVVNIDLFSDYIFYLHYMNKYRNDSKHSGLFNMNELIDAYS